MPRRGCVAGWSVVQKRGTNNGECIAFDKTETDHYGLKGRGYVNLAECKEQRDADMVAACRNHEWDEDYLEYLEIYKHTLDNILSSDEPMSLDMDAINKLVKEMKETQVEPAIYSCFGECKSTERHRLCDKCYAEQHRLWKACASLTIQAQYIKDITKD